MDRPYRHAWPRSLSYSRLRRRLQGVLSSPRTYVRYGGCVELVGRWWNGVWGRMARRGIWLYKDGGRWLVRAREGTADSGRALTWPPFADEWRARAWVDWLMVESPGGRDGWKDVTKLVRKPSKDELP